MCTSVTRQMNISSIQHIEHHLKQQVNHQFQLIINSLFSSIKQSKLYYLDEKKIHIPTAHISNKMELIKESKNLLKKIQQDIKMNKNPSNLYHHLTVHAQQLADDVAGVAAGEQLREQQQPRQQPQQQDQEINTYTTNAEEYIYTTFPQQEIEDKDNNDERKILKKMIDSIAMERIPIF